MAEITSPPGRPSPAKIPQDLARRTDSLDEAPGRPSNDFMVATTLLS
jgi:hypothetical protein